MNTNFVGWNNPVIHDDILTLFEKLYGENGSKYLAVLGSTPPENAVASSLLAYLTTQLMILKEVK